VVTPDRERQGVAGKGRAVHGVARLGSAWKGKERQDKATIF